MRGSIQELAAIVYEQRQKVSEFYSMLILAKAASGDTSIDKTLEKLKDVLLPGRKGREKDEVARMQQDLESVKGLVLSDIFKAYPAGHPVLK